MPFIVQQKVREWPCIWRKWNKLVKQPCESIESAQHWVEMLERCDRNFGYRTEYRIVEVK